MHRRLRCCQSFVGVLAADAAGTDVLVAYDALREHLRLHLTRRVVGGAGRLSQVEVGRAGRLTCGRHTFGRLGCLLSTEGTSDLLKGLSSVLVHIDVLHALALRLGWRLAARLLVRVAVIVRCVVPGLLCIVELAI